MQSNTKLLKGKFESTPEKKRKKSQCGVTNHTANIPETKRETIVAQLRYGTSNNLWTTTDMYGLGGCIIVVVVVMRYHDQGNL